MLNPGKILRLLTLGTLLLLLGNCKNKDCHKDGTCAPDYRKMPLGEAKSYLYALPGSYWIYQNTNTFQLDTQVCVDFICDTVTSKGEDRAKYITIEYERIKRTIVSKFNNIEYYFETNGYNASAPRDLKTIIERWSGLANIQPFFHPFIINDHTGNGASTSTCKGVDSTMNIKGKIYLNVAKFDVDLDGDDEINCNIPVHGTTYYWAKDVGVVKKIVKNCNYTWELIDYKILR